MKGYIIPCTVEQFRHLRLREPDGLVFEPNFNMEFPSLRNILFVIPDLIRDRSSRQPASALFHSFFTPSPPTVLKRRGKNGFNTQPRRGCSRNHHDEHRRGGNHLQSVRIPYFCQIQHLLSDSKFIFSYHSNTSKYALSFFST